MESICYNVKVPVAYKAEVAVLGGGPAGIASAAASARSGRKTALIEKYGFLGGMATAGLVAPLMKCYSVDGSVQIIKGIFEEFVRKLEARGGAVHPSRIRTGTPMTGFLVFGQDHITPIEPEAVKRTADEMLSEAGSAFFSMPNLPM
jgi:phytoene dehydrogenase-like protein